MKAKSLILLLFIVCFSCDEAIVITFTETNTSYTNNSIIELNIPKAEETNEVSKKINKVINDHIANMLSFSEEETDTLSLDAAIKNFEKEYSSFKSDFEESALVWEATFDGEVTYQSPEIITVAINSYLNTGGAHGNMNITLLNFDPLTGDILKFDDIISDKNILEKIAQEYFETATNTKASDGFGDYFFDEGFHLPANIGYNDEGLLLFYNVYEIASYAVGITEFTIPFNEVEAVLKVL